MTEPAAGHAADLVATFADAKLPVPPLPSVGDLVARRDWLWSTRPPPSPPYWLDPYRDELVAAWPDDYLLVSHSGHGVASWVLCWYGVVGSLGVLVQSAWGSPDRDEPQTAVDVDRLQRRFDLVARLIEMAPARLAPEDRLAVVDSDRGTTEWARWTVGTAPVWHDDGDPLQRAVAELGEGPGDG